MKVCGTYGDSRWFVFRWGFFGVEVGMELEYGA